MNTPESTRDMILKHIQFIDEKIAQLEDIAADRQNFSTPNPNNAYFLNIAKLSNAKSEALMTLVQHGKR